MSPPTLGLVSAPTLWEEGRMAGSRVVRLAVLLGLTTLGLDLLVGRDLGLVFDLGFVAACLGAALAVRPHDFFPVGVMPPLLLLGLVSLVAVAERDWVARADDSLVQAVVSGLAHHATALVVGYALTLGVLGVRQRVLGRRLLGPTAQEPLTHDELTRDSDEGVHSNLDGSPAPRRVISGTPSEKSTTVVGSDPHSPESITASNQ